MTETAPSLAVVIDANILIAICCKEEDNFDRAYAAFTSLAREGASFFAPSVIVPEVMYVLCRKLDENILTDEEHKLALLFFQEYMTIISPPPRGDASLIPLAEKTREGYGCSRTSDGLYIALAQELAENGPAGIFTLDRDLMEQVKKGPVPLFVFYPEDETGTLSQLLLK